MICIKNIDIGGFGNKLIYYNNLRQISHVAAHSYYCPRFDNDYIFKFSEEFTNQNLEGEKTNIEFLLQQEFKYLNKKNFDFPYCLGEIFIKHDYISTYEIFKFKEKYTENIDKQNVLTIHFRGKDFHTWDAKSILSVEYYMNAIEDLKIDFKNIKINLYGDDKKLNSYMYVKKYFDQKLIKYQESQNLIDDFVRMSYSDIVISSPSTFCISSCFCGKNNKKIIHSSEWVNYRINSGDLFWIEAVKNNNKNYKIYKTI